MKTGRALPVLLLTVMVISWSSPQAAGQEDRSAAFARPTYIPEELRDPAGRQRDPSPGPDAVLVTDDEEEDETDIVRVLSETGVDAETDSTFYDEELEIETPRPGTPDYDDYDSFEDRLGRSILEPVREDYLSEAYGDES